MTAIQAETSVVDYLDYSRKHWARIYQGHFFSEMYMEFNRFHQFLQIGEIPKRESSLYVMTEIKKQADIYLHSEPEISAMTGAIVSVQWKVPGAASQKTFCMCSAFFSLIDLFSGK